MTAVVIATCIAGSGSVGTAKPGSSGVASVLMSYQTSADTLTAAAPERCPRVFAAVRFYSRRLNDHRRTLGVPTAEVRGKTVGRCPRYLAHVLQRKARAWRLRAESFLAARTLRDFRFCDGCRAWHRAVLEVQRVFPGTSSWLLSCSAAEGGHGRWVGYSGVSYSPWLRDSDTVGGPMQFRFSTFTGMYRRGVDYVIGRGYRVPRMDSTTAWRSALGQAIAAGWARFTGNDNSHWSASWGNGC